MLRIRIWLPKRMESGRKDNQQKGKQENFLGWWKSFTTCLEEDYQGVHNFLAEHLMSFSQSLNLSWPCYLLWPVKWCGSNTVPLLSLCFKRHCLRLFLRTVLLPRLAFWTGKDHLKKSLVFSTLQIMTFLH